MKSGELMKSNISAAASRRWWDLPSLLLLVVLMTTAYSRLVATGWTENLNVTGVISYLGAAAGITLGASLFRPRTTIFFAFIYGAFLVSWRIGLLVGEDISWLERLQIMGSRLLAIFAQLSRQQAVTDNFLFLVLMALLFWSLSVYAGYQMARHSNPWRTSLPLGLALVVIHHYDAFLPGRVWYLVLYLFFSIILVARLAFLKYQEGWQQSNTYMPPYLGVDFVRIALVATTLLLALSWAAPALADSVPAARDLWERTVRGPFTEFRSIFDNAFASLRSSVGLVNDYYGPNLSLGRGNRLTDEMVLTVQVPEDVPPNLRFYWRARTYDHFDNGWSSTELSSRLLDAGTLQLRFPDMSDNAAEDYLFVYAVGKPISTLMTPHQTIWVSRPVRVELNANPDGFADISTIGASPSLRAGEAYSARVSFNDVTVKKLREAGSVYPEWVTERYLQLPDSITQRTRNLAQQLAAGRETPYDIVVAVTGYLRANIEYVESVPPLPINQDLVDWFLFDTKQGFCNYYATAEVILLRSLGIPARMAAGYAQGEDLANDAGYVVRQRDAHAWPEVYFPGIGWVEFEPTSSQPVLVRPLGETITPPSDGALPEDLPLPEDELPLPPASDQDAGAAGEDASGSLALNLLVAVALIGLSAALVVLLIPVVRRSRLYERIPPLPILLESSIRRIGLQPPAAILRWSGLARLEPLHRAYQEINLALGRIRRKPTPSATPNERAAVLTGALPSTKQAAHVLVEEYQKAMYGNAQQVDLASATHASREIRRWSLRAWFQNLLSVVGGSPDSPA
jgi:transglutaminase-like putative cysteine protease